MLDRIAEALYILRTARYLYDKGRSDVLGAALDYNLQYENTYEFNYLVCMGLYGLFDEIYNEENGQNAFIFQDKVMEQYFNLCRLYEGRVGIAPGNNPDRTAAENNVLMLGETSAGGYFGFGLHSDVGRDRHCVIYMHYFEDGSFYLESDVVEVLVDIYAFFRDAGKQLREKIMRFDNRLFQYALPAHKEEGHQ